MFMSIVFSLLSLVACALGAPLVQRDVANPPITSPTAGTVWHTGERQTVTWSTANLPVNITNPDGVLVLGYLSGGSENLMLALPGSEGWTVPTIPCMQARARYSPLATNLNYTVGQVQITVPNVPTRNNYILVLFGDSGNASPQFTIINSVSGSGSAASSTPAETSSSSSPATIITFSSAPSGSPSSVSGVTESSSAGSGGQATTTPTTTSTYQSGTSISTTPSSTATHTTSAASPTQTSAARSRYTLCLHLPAFLLASLIFVL